MNEGGAKGGKGGRGGGRAEQLDVSVIEGLKGTLVASRLKSLECSSISVHSVVFESSQKLR